VLRDAGSAAAFDAVSESALLGVANSGRSPPLSA
jgi:hypothetical protein